MGVPVLECVLKPVLPVFRRRQLVRVHAVGIHDALCTPPVYQVHAGSGFTTCAKSTRGEQPDNERFERFGMDVTSYLVCAQPRITGSHTGSGRLSRFLLKGNVFFYLMLGNTNLYSNTLSPLIHLQRFDGSLSAPF